MNEEHIERMESKIGKMQDLKRAYQHALDKVNEIDLVEVEDKISEIEYIKDISRIAEYLEIYYENTISNIEDNIAERRHEIEGLKGVRFYEKN
jgi:uncharacterized protein YlbG (UPF0298 family)